MLITDGRRPFRWTVKNLPLAIQDFDDSPASRQLIEAFRAIDLIPGGSVYRVDQRPEEAFSHQ